MSTADDDEKHDLSPYELLRLENIRRNQARLEALGLGGGSIATAAGRPNAKNKSALKKKRPRPKDRSNTPALRQQPTRSSKRLKDKKEHPAPATGIGSHAVRNEGDDSADSDAPPLIDYAVHPQEPDQLDDDEFQVYASLRAWRLRRKNELEVEPYKICQNRTLCELIRRVRNNPSWGALKNADGSGERSEEDVAADLIECWGLGPSKVAADGFGPEMMTVIGEKRNVKLLDASRARNISDEKNGEGNTGEKD